MERLVNMNSVLSTRFNILDLQGKEMRGREREMGKGGREGMKLPT